MSNNNTPAPGTGNIKDFLGIGKCKKCSIDGLTLDEYIEQKMKSLITEMHEADSSCSGGGFPSDEYIDIPWGANGMEYVAPDNGWMLMSRITSGASYMGMEILPDGLKINNSGPNANTLVLFLPVAKGQTVRIGWGASTPNYLRFYPARASQGRGIRYSLEEQKTGDYWIDGKPIYQRSWQGITSSGQTDWNIVAHVPEIEQIVDFKVLMPNTQGAWWLRNSNIWGMAAGLAETKRLQFYWYGSNNVMNKPYTATAWYTKTTDAPDQG